MSDQDPRLQDLVRINGRVVAALVGTKEARLNVSTTTLAKSLTGSLSKAAEIRAASQLLASEKVARLDALKPDAIKALAAHRGILAAERQRVEKLAATNPGRPANPTQDLLMGQKWLGMDVSQRTITTARAMADTSSAWADFILRQPRELTDVPAEMWQQLRQAVLQARDPALVEAVELQEEMLEVAQRASDLAAGLLNETFVGIGPELQAAEVPAVDAHDGQWTDDAKRAAFNALPEAIKADFTRPAPVEQRSTQ